ncbi:RHS repeat protein [bacterium]|nr:RHS repeat protein [bacterium]
MMAKIGPSGTTSPLGLYSESNYLNGLLMSMTMPSNQGSSSLRRETQFYYDLADRLEQVQGQVDFVSSSPVFELRVGYVYDGLSQLKNLVRLKDATTKAAVYDYDFLGRLVRSEDFLVPGRETFIAYADYCTGNLTTTPRGVQREATYDERCRLRQLQTQDETHEFDYDELNRLIRVRMGSRFAHDSPPVGGKFSTGFYTHETRYTYDELDRVVEILYPNGETVSYEYNENGDVTRMVDVHGKETLYEYYHDGRLLSVTYESQVFTYTYDAVGRLESLTYPTTPDDLVLNFSWYDGGRLLSMEYLKNSAAFQSFTYSYDDSGNRVTMDEVNPSSVTTSWEYGYDWFNRLTRVTKNSTEVESYTYDESDNRKTRTRPLVSELWEYSYDLADQLESITVTVGAGSPVLVESFTPDEDGNVLSRDKGGVVTEYQWDTMNRLRQVKVDGDVVVRSLYDAEGIRRLSKDDSGDQSKFFSSGGMSLADQRASGPVSFMQGHQLLGAQQGGDFHFYITDALGSVRLVVDEAGDVEGAFAHDAWGVPDTGVTPPGAELRAHSFVGGLGQRNDTASLGLYYARQRYYDPTLQRFISRDPIGLKGGANVYTYASNAPMTNTDEFGLAPKPGSLPGGTSYAGAAFCLHSVWARALQKLGNPDTSGMNSYRLDNGDYVKGPKPKGCMSKFIHDKYVHCWANCEANRCLMGLGASLGALSGGAAGSTVGPLGTVGGTVLGGASGTVAGGAAGVPVLGGVGLAFEAGQGLLNWVSGGSIGGEPSIEDAKVNVVGASLALYPGDCEANCNAQIF